jgi:hypothetical protein
LDTFLDTIANFLFRNAWVQWEQISIKFSFSSYSNAADQGIGIGQSDFIDHDFFLAKVFSMQEKKKEAWLVLSK